MVDDDLKIPGDDWWPPYHLGVTWPRWITENRALSLTQIALEIAFAFGAAAIVVAVVRSLASLPVLYLTGLFLVVAGGLGLPLFQLLPRPSLQAEPAATPLRQALAMNRKELTEHFDAIEAELAKRGWAPPPVVAGRRLSLTELEKVEPDLASERKKYSERALQERHREEKAKLRRAIHEVVTTLEQHKGDLTNWQSRSTYFKPSYQGAWPENRQMFGAYEKYDQAFRATERALQAVGRISQYAAQFDPIEIPQRMSAINAIDRALSEWETLLQGRNEKAPPPDRNSSAAA